MSQDKAKHFMAGLFIAAVLLFAGLAINYTVFVVALIGGAKELIDSIGYGTPEFMDWVWTILGVVPAVVVFLMI